MLGKGLTGKEYKVFGDDAKVALKKYSIDNGFKIPFGSVNGNITDNILSLISHRYALTVVEELGRLYYVLRSLEGYFTFTRLIELKEESVWSDYLDIWFKGCNYRKFKSVATSRYFRDSLCADTIDFILKEASKIGPIDGRSLGIMYKHGKGVAPYLDFVEVRLK